MSPIDKISDIRRLPRLGKIRLGIKKEGQRGPYPQAVNYFVCPEEVKAIYKDKPTELDIMFPTDDLDLVAPQWYKCYSYTQGLICKGDGKHCKRKVDVDTGDFADKSTREWDLHDGICDPENCPKLEEKQCRKMMSLLFILPEIPGLGVYQLDTSSFYSIVNINSQLAQGGFIRPFTKGRIAFIPLKLSIGPQDVNPPGVGRKTVHVLSVRADVKLADIIRISRQAPAQVLLPTIEEEQPPEDLFPEEVVEHAEKAAATPEGGGEAPPKGEEKIGAAAEEKRGAAGKPEPTILSPPAPEKTPKIAAAPPTELEGEGFHIDLTWLDESLNEIKWSTDTLKTYLTSKYKVSPSGTREDVLKRLSRDQAEEFVKEIQNRVAQQQIKLF